MYVTSSGKTDLAAVEHQISSVACPPGLSVAQTAPLSFWVTSESHSFSMTDTDWKAQSEKPSICLFSIYFVFCPLNISPTQKSQIRVTRRAAVRRMTLTHRLENSYIQGKGTALVAIAMSLRHNTIFRLHCCRLCGGSDELLS